MDNAQGTEKGTQGRDYHMTLLIYNFCASAYIVLRQLITYALLG